MSDLAATWGLAGVLLLLAAVIAYRSCRDGVRAFRAGLRGLPLPERKTPRWRKELNRFLEDTTLWWILVLGFVAVVGYALWSTYHQRIFDLALVALIVAAGFLDAMGWRFWVIFLAGLVWLYSYRRNRQRQEAIIELLLEIKSKLDH